MRDRVAQEVIRRLIEPYFEPYFSTQSFGFRPHRSCHDAIRELRRLWKLGYRIVLDADIKGFFDNIPHALIMKAEIEKALELVRCVIEQKLGLQLSPEKTIITSFAGGFDFLGFHFNQRGAVIRTKSVEKLKEKIRTLTIRSHNFCDEVITKINRVTRGYVNYYATEFSNVMEQFFRLDQFIRRRLRCMKKKRISKNDNYRIPNRYFERKQLISLYSLALSRQRTFNGSPYCGARLKGRQRQTV